MAENCGSLLYELQIIWDEIGESEAEREEILHEIEPECLEVDQKRVDRANQLRTQLKQKIAEVEAELAAICTAMGEQPAHIGQEGDIIHSLKAEFGNKVPQLEEMRERKYDRKKQFIEVLSEIQLIKYQNGAADALDINGPIIDDNDLSVKKLQELQMELKALQEEEEQKEPEGQILTEQSANKRPRLSCGGVNNRNLSFVGDTTLQNPEPTNELPHSAEATSCTCKKKRNGPTPPKISSEAEEGAPRPQRDVSSTASGTPLHIAADNAADEDDEEYSFEELRARFVVKNIALKK